MKVEDDEQRGIPLSKVVNDAVALSNGNAPQDKDDNPDGRLNRIFLSPDAGAAPSRIPFRPLSSLETIRSISVSARCGTYTQLLCLSSFGVVYYGSYGDSDSDGNAFASSLLPIESFLLNGPIIQVSAGPKISAAIDSDGTLYTWGRRFGSSASPTVTSPRAVEALKDYQVLQVSCGGSFMLVRAKQNGLSSTSVFSWGLLASGSTGLGRLELRPARISALDDEDICDVSAGESHGLAVSSSGKVFAWGSNADGQCGVAAGVTENHRGMLDDVWTTPRMIEPFGIDPKARSVSAGSSTSAVIDTDGRLWTWGGGGNKAFLLGHGEGFDPSEYMCPIVGQDGKQEMVPAASGRAVANIARLSGCLKVPSFCKPRVVEGLKDSIIAKVDISSTLGAAITQTNRLYVWGGNGEMTSSVANGDTSEATVIHTPMILSTESVVEIASSSMLGLFFVSDGPALSNEVGGFLLAQRNQSDLADCRIITATGKAIRCHSLVIACRSTVLREMVEHHRHGEAEENATIELLLPGIKEETALALLEYLYTDTISASQISSSLLTVRLLEAAETLQLPGLVEICHRCLLEDADLGMSATGGAAMHLSTLAQDFASALKDGISSDVHIIARGGEIIPAHWSILTARSSFFREAHQQMSPSQRYNTATLHVSESRQTIGRLLHYIYTSEIVGQCNQNDLIEDLQSVNKYGVEAAKPLIASSLRITGENADEMYLLSKQTGSNLLQQRALQVLSQRTTQDSGALSAESADAVSAWAKERRLLSTIPKEGFKTAMDELKRVREEEAERIKQVERDMAMGFGEGLPVPLLLGLATATVAVYVAVQYFGDDGGPVVMAANTLFIGVALRYAHKALM